MSCTDNPNHFIFRRRPKDDAEKFLADAEKRLLDLNIKAGRADWVKSTFITDDTEALAADANETLIGATTELAEQSRRYENADLSPEAKRKLKLLKLSLTLPAPKDPNERERSSQSSLRRWKAITAKANTVLTAIKANVSACPSWKRSWATAAIPKN